MKAQRNETGLIKAVGWGIMAEYLITTIHHVIEGLGLIFEFRIKSLITPVTFGIPLLITLGLLYLYRKTRNSFILAVFSITTALWWIFGIGLMDGFYNHTLNVLLYLLNVSAAVMTKIYPTYTPPSSLGGSIIPCDGIQFSYCVLRPATIVYEAAGIISFFVACMLVSYIYRLIREKQNRPSTAQQTLSRPVILGVSFGLVASFGAVPLLTAYMTSGRLPSLILALLLMGASMLPLAVTIVWLKKKEGDNPPFEKNNLVGGENAT